MKIILPEKVNTIIHTLQENGFEAYAVGGFTRDMIMGRPNHDTDITTSALPEEIKEIFSGFRTVDTGIKHGTVTVIIDGVPLEITTYRIEKDYTDGRHPDEVIFTRSLKEDLKRRDFTINAFDVSISKLFRFINAFVIHSKHS